jgi:hypothetical protein
LKRASHPPYSPDLAPSDFYLFAYVKHQLQRHEFTEGAKLVSVISEILNQIPTDALADVFDDWVRRCYSDVLIPFEITVAFPKGMIFIVKSPEKTQWR